MFNQCAIEDSRSITFSLKGDQSGDRVVQVDNMVLKMDRRASGVEISYSVVFGNHAVKPYVPRVWGDFVDFLTIKGQAN